MSLIFLIFSMSKFNNKSNHGNLIKHNMTGWCLGFVLIFASPYDIAIMYGFVCLAIIALRLYLFLMLLLDVSV